MEGGLTRHRAYLWLTAAGLALLLIGLWTYRSQASSVALASLPTTDTMPTAQQQSFYQNQRTTHCSDHATTASYHRRQCPAPAYTPEQPPATIYHKDKQLMFNLNTADSLDLVQLYNIGPAFANRIIRYRTRLGGFADKQQLWEVYGMDSARYNDIAPHLFVNPDDITKLDLNQVSYDQLKRHPYLDYYQAKAIVQLRESAGPFHQIQDILNIPIIDKETFTHIAPYLSCNSQPNK